MKKKKTCKLLGIMLATLLTGCSTPDIAYDEKEGTSEAGWENSQEVDNDQDDSVKNEGTKEAETFEYNSDKVHVALTLDMPTDTLYQCASAEFMNLNCEDIGRKLMQGEYSKIPNQWYGETESFGWNSNYNSFTYRHTDIEEYMGSCVYTEERNPAYNLDAYTTPCEFAFASEEEALDDVKSQMEELGIVIDDTWLVETYYLDYNILQQEEYHMGIDGNDVPEDYKTDWSEADNSYLFSFSPTYCGEPYQYYNFLFYDWRGPGSSPLLVYYNASGIWKVECNQLFTIEASAKQIQLKDFEDIIRPLINRYENMIDTSAYEITEARFFWRIEGDKGNVELQPVWAFRIVATTAEGDVDYSETQIQAETGVILQ